MKMLIRFVKRIWYYNSHVELDRQYNSLAKRVNRIAEYWENLSPEARKAAVKKSRVLRTLLKYWKLADLLFGGEANDAAKW